MKNLANCKPSEFLRQTSKIRKAAERWMKATDILNIRKNVPKLEVITKDMDAETAAKISEENRKRREEQMNRNFSAMLDAVLDEHPDETLEMLALLCFIDPKDVDDHPMEEYIEAATEMMNNQAVIGFFTSLAQLGLMNISKGSKA